MPSIEDVALKAGVSISTVSRVLNDHPNVSGEKKRAVEKAISELDYIPNALARGLVTRSTYSIGILISDIANDFYSILVRSMEDVLNSEGYFTVIGNTDWKKKKEKKYIKFFRQKQVDGLILASTTLKGKEIRKFSSDLPVIVLDREMKVGNIDKIRINDFKGGYLAASHLLDAGYQYLVHIEGPQGIISAEDRRKGFLKAVEEGGVPGSNFQIVKGHYTKKAGFKAIKRLIENKKNSGKNFSFLNKPLGIFAANDAMAFGVLNYLNNKGISCPEKVGVVGFDDVEMSGYTNPSLTSVTRPISEIGKRAASLLLERLKKEDGEQVNRDIHFNVELIERQSTSLKKTVESIG